MPSRVHSLAIASECITRSKNNVIFLIRCTKRNLKNTVKRVTLKFKNIIVKFGNIVVKRGTDIKRFPLKSYKQETAGKIYYDKRTHTQHDCSMVVDG